MPKKSLTRIAVTGGAGQIAYNLLFRIASGEMFGANQPIALHILEVPEALKALEGVQMELQDCAYPLLKEIVIGSDPMKLFKDIDYALLVGAKPRGPGMERGELLADNGKIFVEQGKALDRVADKNVKVLVVGNPCNTNCLIAMHNAPSLPKKNFHAMTRLDQNRAEALLAAKAKVDVENVSNVIIWGNHSATQVPDAYNAKISGQTLIDKITDQKWLQEEFILAIQKRGAAIIAARGKSSAASAANAIIDAIKALHSPTPSGQWFSSGVYIENTGYEIANGLVFSVPCRSKGDGSYEIVQNIAWNDFLKNRIKLTEKELLEERDLVSSLIPTEIHK